MNKSSKGSSFFSGALQLFKGKPTPIKASAARKSSARILAKQGRQASSTVSSPYRAAEIVCAKNACDSVRALSGTRFLLAEVPRIPVLDCTSPNCRCTYTRHSDRRNLSEERRAQFSMRTKAYPTLGYDERRRKFGRRTGEAAGAAERYDFKNWDI